MSSDSLDNYRLLGRSGLRVSPLCLGTMTFGENWGFGSGFEESKKVFDSYYEQGGNFVDTANVYTEGESERFLGKMIGERRSSLVVATKYTNSTDGMLKKAGKLQRGNPLMSGNSRKSLVENVDGCLKRMGLDYIDLLYVHAWEFRTPVDEVLRSLDDLVRSGKVLYLGISDTPAWVVSQGNTTAHLRGWSPFVAMQTRYNLLDRSYEFEYEPMAAEHGLTGVGWGALAEGFLTGKFKKGSGETGSREAIKKHVGDEQNWRILAEVEAVAEEVKKTPSQVALRWMSQRGVLPLVGARTQKQLDENVGSLSFTLTPEQVSRLDAASKPKNVPFPYTFLADKAFIERGFMTSGESVEYPPQYRSFFQRL